MTIDPPPTPELGRIGNTILTLNKWKVFESPVQSQKIESQKSVEGPRADQTQT